MDYYCCACPCLLLSIGPAGVVEQSDRRAEGIGHVELAYPAPLLGDYLAIKHPYSETCIVLSGQAAMVVEGEEVVADAGDIVVIGSATSHRFTALGDEWLDMICVHASDRFLIEWLRD